MKAVLVPWKLNEQMREVEGESIRALAQQHWTTHPGGRYIERVNTVPMANEGFLMVVDEEGHDRELPINIRAMLISQYPGGPIVGDVLLACEARDSYGEIDWAELNPNVMKILERWGIEAQVQAALGTMIGRDYS